MHQYTQTRLQDRLQHKACQLPRKFQLPPPGQNTTTIVERVETGLVSGQDSLNIRETCPSFCFPFMNPRNPKLVNIFENMHGPIELSSVLEYSSQRRRRGPPPGHRLPSPRGSSPQPCHRPTPTGSGHMAFCRGCGHRPRFRPHYPPSPESLLALHTCPLHSLPAASSLPWSDVQCPSLLDWVLICF